MALTPFLARYSDIFSPKRIYPNIFVEKKRDYLRIGGVKNEKRKGKERKENIYPYGYIFLRKKLSFVMTFFGEMLRYSGKHLDFLWGKVYN